MFFPTVDQDRRYWFVRTEHGLFYNEFKNMGIIAIGWDRINNINLIKHAATDTEANKQLESLVKKAYPEEKRFRYVAGQIKTFVNEIKKGDIVLIPNTSSRTITFGEVDSNDLIPVPSFFEKGMCEWEKRKKVSWLKTVRRDNLDPNLFRLGYSQHAVTDGSSYDHFIDRTLYSFYVKGDMAHLTLEATKQKDISANDLVVFINSSLHLVDIYNKETGEHLDKNSINIKINLQSPAQ